MTKPTPDPGLTRCSSPHATGVRWPTDDCVQSDIIIIIIINRLRHISKKWVWELWLWGFAGF